jgi:hypothetical protein
MKKVITFIMGLIATFMLVACGGSDTYTASGTAEPGVPVEGDALIISSGATEGSVSSVSYTTLEDGSILVTCNGGACGDISVGFKDEGSEETEGDCEIEANCN